MLAYWRKNGPFSYSILRYYSRLICQNRKLGGSLREYSSLICENVEGLVGKTPLIKLRLASELTNCTILGKCEFLNPGGSVKDRPAVKIINQGEELGILKPSPSTAPIIYSHKQSKRNNHIDTENKLIVEGSAGNTAIGLALYGNPKGYTTICVLPDTQSQEKKDALRASGALLVEVSFAKVWHPNHFVKLSGRLAKNLNAFWGNQFDNKANFAAHYETTGPEIWQQTNGKIDGFVSVVGTGGTLNGVSTYLKQQNPRIAVALADIPGAVLYRYYTTGEIKASGSSIVENIGQGRITDNLEGLEPDIAYEIPDTESLPWCNALLKEEGLPVGMSSGVNVAGAVRLARHLGPGHLIVTILCDYGQRYAKKQYNKSFLQDAGLPYPFWLNKNLPLEDMIKSAVEKSFGTSEELSLAESKYAKNSVPGSKI